MKKFVVVLTIVVMAFSLATGCRKKDKEVAGGVAPGKDTVTDTQKEPEALTDAEKYYSVVEGFFPTSDKYMLYNGYAEAGFQIKYESMKKDAKKIDMVYAGEMTDGVGDPQNLGRTFSVTYTIDDKKITESVVNKDYLKEYKNNVYSIIPDLIVLQGDIEKGNKWDQDFILGKMDYIAETEITEATEKGFKTKTVVNGVDGFKDNAYIEERAYEFGKGLVSFTNTPEGSDKDSSLIFGYSFSGESDLGRNE